jgi:enoyl-CoA hydratase/carnithine racemase
MMKIGSFLADDYVIVPADARISIDSPEAWAGAVWRIGRRALGLHIEGKTSFTAEEALGEGLIDEIGNVREQPPDSARSDLALESAAMLVRHRGGDALERAEFARLFAAGEPQAGLRAFLEKRRSPRNAGCTKLLE